MREQILQDIEESIFEIGVELEHAKKDWFTQLCFEKWALLEIRELILKKPDASPWIIVDEFMSLMNRYTLDFPGNNDMFSIAYDTAWGVLSEIIGGEPPN